MSNASEQLPQEQRGLSRRQLLLRMAALGGVVLVPTVATFALRNDEPDRLCTEKASYDRAISLASNSTSNGTSNSTSNGTSNSTSNGATNSTSNSRSNSTSNSYSNSTSNSTSNGSSNSTSNSASNLSGLPGQQGDCFTSN